MRYIIYIKIICLYSILNIFSCCVYANTAADAHITLDNGLKIIFKENNDNPIILLQLWHDHIIENNNNQPINNNPHLEYLKKLVFEQGGTNWINQYTDCISRSYMIPSNKSVLKAVLQLQANLLEFDHANNNPMLIIAGDLDLLSTKKLVKSYFNNINFNKYIQTTKTLKIKTLATKQLDLSSKILLPNFYVQYKVPSLNTAKHNWEPFAIELLVAILHKKLINNPDLSNINIKYFYEPFLKHDSLAVFSVIFKNNINNINLETFKKIINKQIISKLEFINIKNNILVQNVNNQESLLNQINKMGQLSIAGYNCDLINHRAQIIKDLTFTQIQDVAKKYFYEK